MTPILASSFVNREWGAAFSFTRHPFITRGYFFGSVAIL